MRTFITALISVTATVVAAIILDAATTGRIFR
jgi:hypothetical protein